MDFSTRLLLACGRVRPPSAEAIEPLLAALGEEGRARLLELAAFHRVQPQLHANLEAIGPELGEPAARAAAAAIVAALAPRVAAIASGVAACRAEFERAVAARVAPLTAIKGLAVSGLYNGRSGPRELADVDAWVPAEDFWPLVAHQVDAGYAITKVRFGDYRLHRGDPAYPSAYGICLLVLGDGDDAIGIDVHFGAFPACGDGLVLLGPADIERNGGLARSRPEKALQILLAHGVRQGFCRLRDVNDFHLLTAAVGPEMAQVTRAARGLQLTPMLAAMARLERLIYADDGVPDPSRMRVVDRQLLLGPRIADSRFLDDLRLGYSRLWQVRYLIDLYVAHLGWLRGIARALWEAPQLFRTGRPYRTWDARRVGGIGERERFVLRPFVRVRQPIEPSRLTAAVAELGLTTTFVPRLGLTVVNPGADDEIVISEGFINAQTDYDGTTAVPAAPRALAQRLIDALALEDWTTIA